VARSGLASPAVIVLGEVAALAQVTVAEQAWPIAV
jgi:uroporphyrin-III C-methyltransferase